VSKRDDEHPTSSFHPDLLTALRKNGPIDQASRELVDNLDLAPPCNLNLPVRHPSCPAISAEDELLQVLIVLTEDGRVKNWTIIARSDISEGIARKWLHRLKIGEEDENGE